MDSHKKYCDFTNEISSTEIYKGLLAFGLFTEKLPPVFSSKSFFDYCQTNNPNFPHKPTEYIYFESMRNTNVPRALGIPNPATYQLLCKYISEIWPELQSFFEEQTKDQNHIISRIHIRQMLNTDSLFSMNYKNWRIDGTPEPDLLLGAKYLVHADISNCFPSIYTHALSWALVGKDFAKQTRNASNAWYNKLDLYVRNIKAGETHGLLIGPHISNLLSEIILTKIDVHLYGKGWRYTRNIDDYTCYVSTFEKGQLFLTELSEQLHFYDLALNHKKTAIKELPTASVEQWVRKINAFTAIDEKKVMNFKEVRAYLDLAIELMQDNNENAAIINYSMKVLANKSLSANAKAYFIKTISHLAVIYPYIISLLEDYVFIPFGVDKQTIQTIANLIYAEGISSKNYETICYALYYSIKYGFVIDDVTFEAAKQSNDCLFLLFAYLYFQKNDDKRSVKYCKDYAKALSQNYMDSFWLFIYEVLPQSELREYWKHMKKNGVTFLLEI